MNETLRKKYIPMTETTYYTLLAVMAPRHGYAIMQYVSSLTEGRIVLGTGTLYTMVGRLVADGVIEVALGSEKKTYSITPAGLELLQPVTDAAKSAAQLNIASNFFFIKHPPVMVL